MELVGNTEKLFKDLNNHYLSCKDSIEQILNDNFESDENINSRLNDFYNWYTKQYSDLNLDGINKKKEIEKLKSDYIAYISNLQTNIQENKNKKIDEARSNHNNEVNSINDNLSNQLNEQNNKEKSQIKTNQNNLNKQIDELDDKIEAQNQEASTVSTNYSSNSEKIKKSGIIDLFTFPSRKRNLLKKLNIDTSKKLIDTKIEISKFEKKKITINNTYEENHKKLIDNINNEKAKLEKDRNEKLKVENEKIKKLEDEINSEFVYNKGELEKQEENEITNFEQINKTEKQSITSIQENIKSDFEKFQSLNTLNITGSHYNILPFDNEGYQLFSNFEKNIKEIDKRRKYSSQHFIPIGLSPLNGTKVPLIIPFIHSNNIIFNYSTENGKKILSNFIDSIMFRTLLTLPNGKVNFTFIDPNGMGENCSKLLGLNHDMYGKVYVGDSEIDEQMNNLSSFVAYVNTKYLRHEYKNIKEYNQGVGEIEEPYKVMVAYDFPDNYKIDSLKKLKGIMQNGTRTGIQTILLKEKNPTQDEDSINVREQEKIISDLEKLAIIITENNGYFEIKNLPGYDSQYLSNVEIAPNFLIDLDLSKNITEYANKKFETVDDIKVSYIDQVQDILGEKTFWTKDASEAIEANIGKSGRENQYFRINNKIEAHALLIGRSGSGKSNLLHMIITDLALNYSPETLNLYLIDMKGGIEFIRYIEHGLPHAKVASITSDREMAYSILVGLEQELQKREELLSSKGVQEIASFNKKFENEKIPRILLVLDEFQELFSKEDFIKRQSLDIFDRLAKKGRSFGINMILASQSLGGETIASTTLHQFAVRIVLQCSEDDSTRALSSNNTEAKLLSRPGEGIYNSQNGQKDGNQRFQTYWMDDNEDEDILINLKNYVQSNEISYDQRVFREDIKPKYESYYSNLTSGEYALQLPLGQPFSLDDSVNIELTKESGSNIFISGTNDEGAMNIFISMMASLILLKKRNFYILNTYAPNHPETQKLNDFIETVESFDINITVLNNKNIEEKLRDLETIIDSNSDGVSPDLEDNYLMVFAPYKLRSFKKEGYSLSNAAMIFDKIIKDGGECSIHTVMYMETQKNLENMFEHSTRNYFQIVIALQMSSEDSNRLISSEAASNLGRDNALLCIEDINLVQKFRPLELPNDVWLGRKLENLNN